MNTINKLVSADNFWTVIPKLKKTSLVSAIKLAAHHYYHEADPLLTDEIYDAMVEKLKSINPNEPILGKIGAPVTRDAVKLPYRLGSMDKIKTDEKALVKWTRDYSGPYVASDKLDGVSCLIVEKKSKVKLFTRGDATHGKDITHLIEYINTKSIDKIPKTNHNLAIRGELIISKKNFEKIKNDRAGARSAVAGIVNSKQERLDKKIAKLVEFVAYEIIEPYYLPSKQFELLEKWGLTVAFNKKMSRLSLENLGSIYKKRQEKTLFDIDGIIVTDDNDHPRKFSGNPPYSFAYKGISETADVKVLEIPWKPQKDGHIIPRVRYTPVKLSNGVLRYSAGFNARFIVDNKLGPGAIIKVVRSGETIPHILHIVKPAKEPSMPDYDYHWDSTAVNIILDNPDSDVDVRIQRLVRFVTQIGVKHMSEGIITKLVSAGFDNMRSIMTMEISDYEKIEGFKKTLATKLYNSMQAALDNLDMVTLMSASNIFGRGFGRRKIKKILAVYPNIVEEYSRSNKKKTIDNIIDIDGFDVKTATLFVSNLRKFQKFYSKISDLIDLDPVHTKKSGRFDGMKFVFTGFTGKDWKDIIENEGGEIGSSVTKNTTALVYLDESSTSSKSKNADKFNIKKISKDEFAKKYKLK